MMFIVTMQIEALHVPFFCTVFSPFQDGLNAFLWCCLHMTSQEYQECIPVGCVLAAH